MYNNIKKSCNNSKVLNIDLLNENPLSQSSPKYEKKNVLFNSNMNTIEINDNSSDSIPSISTNILYQRNHNTRSNHSLIHSSSTSNSRNITLLNVDDENSVKNVLPTNNFNTQMLSLNNEISVIDLIEDSNSGSISTIETPGILKSNSKILFPTSFNNAHQTDQNLSTSINLPSSRANLSTKCETNNSSDENCSTNTNIKSNKDFNLNSAISSSNRTLYENEDNSVLVSKLSKKSFQQNNISPTFLNTLDYAKHNDIENDDKDNRNKIFTNKKSVLDDSNLESEILENTIIKTNLTFNNFDSLVQTKKVVNLKSCSSNDSSITPINAQVEPFQSSEIINISKITLPNENYHEQDKSDSEQIIDDPWMDYDWSNNISPQHVTTALSESESIVLDTFEEQTQKNKNDHNINLNLLTPSNISNCSNKTISQKNNAITPNKYGSRMNTPKSLRRVQSESVIGSKEEVTPLPDYSAMKTPDLRVSIIF